MIEIVLDKIVSNPILLAASFAVLILLGLFLLKKLFKMALGVVVLIIAGIAIIYVTSENPKQTIQEVVNESKKQAKSLSKEAEKVGKDLLNDYKEKQQK